MNVMNVISFVLISTILAIILGDTKELYICITLIAFVFIVKDYIQEKNNEKH